MKFEWDSGKAAGNLNKHGVNFDEAATVFLDQLAVSGPDPDHSIGESRYITFGISSLGHLLAVSHTYRQGAIRLFSARRVTRLERKIYEEG
ncbi:MAG: BrnT family toxin [Ramlibacter sp.]|nr:BrnT family toxin [Ramlibacter sp.]